MRINFRFGDSRDSRESLRESNGESQDSRESKNDQRADSRESKCESRESQRGSIFDEKSRLRSHERGNKTDCLLTKRTASLLDLSQKDNAPKRNALKFAQNTKEN